MKLLERLVDKTRKLKVGNGSIRSADWSGSR